MSFAGKIVLITGAGSGIGAATAVRFAHLGASLVLVGRNVDNLNNTAILCPKRTTDDISIPIPLIISADVNTDAQRIIDETISHFGRLDVLVNNAGVGGRSSLDSDTSVALEQFDTIITTNVRSVYHLTMLAVPHLVASGGNIVNVSSLVGLRPFAGYLVYGISKAALDQLTYILALELGPRGVRCNSVNPALILTDFQLKYGMDDSAVKAFREHSKKTYPIGRIGLPEDVAAAIVFLANNNDAGFLTGTLLPVDGGKTISSSI